MVKMLFLLNDGPDASSSAWIEALSQKCEVEVIDLARKEVSYDALVEKIFTCDRLISW
ncbi:MAG: hypothetical protein ABIH03_07135 [Pseudomonadota bacterium]